MHQTERFCSIMAETTQSPPMTPPPNLGAGGPQGKPPGLPIRKFTCGAMAARQGGRATARRCVRSTRRRSGNAPNSASGQRRGQGDPRGHRRGGRGPPVAGLRRRKPEGQRKCRLLQASRRAAVAPPHQHQQHLLTPHTPQNFQYKFT